MPLRGKSIATAKRLQQHNLSRMNNLTLMRASSFNRSLFKKGIA
jgi:hypothetical protein